MTQRETLSEIVKKELDNLPSLLEDMKVKERIQIVIKLLPFVLPKPDAEPEISGWISPKKDF